MFRKTWKQIRIFVILLVILVCLPHSILPHQSYDIPKEVLEDYNKLNQSEQRLAEYKDDDQALKLKLSQLDVINKSRKRYNAGPVKLDILASRVANKMCREAAEHNFVGHWNMAGEKPYHRYAFAGGYDHVSENAYGEWSSAKYIPSGVLSGSLMKAGHQSFMSERAPNDGHKQNIIEKTHNYVGLGYFLTGNQFRYYEEFIDRYLTFENIPSQVKPGDQFNITLKTADNSFLYFVIIYYEKFPLALTPDQITKKGSYADFTDDEAGKILPWELSRYRNGTNYSIPLSFSKEGLYYIQAYIDNKEITKPGSLSTKGKTPVSGIVIKVRN